MPFAQLKPYVDISDEETDMFLDKFREDHGNLYDMWPDIDEGHPQYYILNNALISFLMKYGQTTDIMAAAPARNRLTDRRRDRFLSTGK